ncbi:uncharacterized protein PG998_005656 [Apiospora kogelbergensis]|uniref:uncharacterized protein n=1 Tax=Apiospora kogelbergensis TaxID=1337665 RepID=UPI00312FADF0
MRFIAVFLSVALCVVAAYAGECNSDKHQDGDVFCGNKMLSFQCSAGVLSVKDRCADKKVCSDKGRDDGSRYGATCG